MAYRYNDRWPPYVSVAERRRQAEKKIAAMSKKGKNVEPVIIDGRAITSTFWGKAWCDNLESYQDFENRLPRGRSYVRNGSVLDLKISAGKIRALVNGASVYTVEIDIDPLDKRRWRGVIDHCAGKIDSLVELLQGKLSKNVMETVTSKEKGLFPAPKQISMKCSCPDWATMCKHVAATLYGVGNRLDKGPDLLFQLRQVDHMELIAKASIPTALDDSKKAKGSLLESTDLGSLFGIEMEPEVIASPKPTTRPAKKNVLKTRKFSKKKK